jgi:hypothetical protein
MALLERLQILIDADAKGAIREFDKIGDQADRAAKRTEDRFQKVGNKLTSLGTKGFVGGAVVLGGLAKLATLSDEAEKQTLKLENSIKNSDQAFRGNGRALTDLAKSLQQVTAADADAIVGAESLLVSFGLTEDQVKAVTPLVVDLSRKLGVDLDTAAKTVGKALAGNAGGLKRYGVNVDEAKLKTNAFGAVVDALGKSVGGFAVREGRTFSGQVEILKNNLGDLGETVGKGAVSVFGDLAGALVKVTGAAGNANPAIGETVGKIAAFGGIGVTGVSGLAVVAGQAIKLRDAFTTLGDDGTRSINRLGKAAAGFGVVVGTIAAVDIIGGLVNDINDYAAKSEDAIRRLNSAVKSSSDPSSLEAFGKAVRAVQDEWLGLGEIVTSIGREVKIEGAGIAVDIENVGVAFDRLLQTGGPEAGQALVAALIRQRDAAGQGTQAYRDLGDVLLQVVPKLQSATSSTDLASLGNTNLVQTTDQATAAYKQFQDTLSGTIDPVLGAINANKALQDAQQRVAEAQGKVTALFAQGKVGTEEYAAAQRTLEAANQAQITAAFGTGRALAALGQVVAESPAKLAAFTAELDRLRSIGAITQAQYDQVTRQLKAATDGVNALGDAITQQDGKSAVLNVEVAYNAQGVTAIRTAQRQGRIPDNVPSGSGTGNVTSSGNYGSGINVTSGGNYGRALGGPVTKSVPYTVNEVGPEMFVPSSNGFVMTASDSKRLVAGVEQMLAGTSSGVKVDTINIASTDPQLTAREVVRGLRSATYLMGR